MVDSFCQYFVQTAFCNRQLLWGCLSSLFAIGVQYDEASANKGEIEEAIRSGAQFPQLAADMLGMGHPQCKTKLPQQPKGFFKPQLVQQQGGRSTWR